MRNRFVSKTIIITGAASGLGAACARKFAAMDANLILVDYAGDRLAALGEDLRKTMAAPVREIVGDVTQSTTAETAIQHAIEFGGPHILVNNAAIDPLAARSVSETSDALWDSIMAVNVKAAFLFTRATLPEMIRLGGGAIVNIASISAILPSPNEAAYSVSKAALLQLTRATALDYAAQGIRANCICPGMLEAVMSDRQRDLTPADLLTRSTAAAAAVPMGREGRYDEIASAVAFLASDDSAYTTGATLVIDGGLTLR